MTSWVPVRTMSTGVNVFTLAWVATMTYAGVRTTPWGVSSKPKRARPKPGDVVMLNDGFGRGSMRAYYTDFLKIIKCAAPELWERRYAGAGVFVMIGDALR